MRGEGQKGGSINVLKYAFWNINGYKSRVIGNKFINREFLQAIKECDVIRLAETHIHSLTLDRLVIPWFVRIHHKNRKPHSNGRCGSGSIALFIKEHMPKFISQYKMITKKSFEPRSRRNFWGKKGIFT